MWERPASGHSEDGPSRNKGANRPNETNGPRPSGDPLDGHRAGYSTAAVATPEPDRPASGRRPVPAPADLRTARDAVLPRGLNDRRLLALQGLRRPQEQLLAQTPLDG